MINIYKYNNKYNNKKNLYSVHKGEYTFFTERFKIILYLSFYFHILVGILYNFNDLSQIYCKDIKLFKK